MSTLRLFAFLSVCLLSAMLFGQTQAQAHGQDGQGMGMGMGPGMMDDSDDHHGYDHHGDGHHGDGHHGDGGYGGHMGYGMGMGMRMGHHMGAVRSTAYSLEEISVLMSARLILMGNPRLTLGKVTAEDDDTAIVEIVTQDGSVVDRLAVDRWDLHVWRVE